MASINREVTGYTFYEYEKLADELLIDYNKEGRSSYPLGSFIQALRSNSKDEKGIKFRLTRYTDLSLFYDVLYRTPMEDLPMYINDETFGVAQVARWRMRLGD